MYAPDLQSVVSSATVILIAIGLFSFIYWAAKLKDDFYDFLKTKLSKKQLEIVQQLAADAYIYAEAYYKGEDGQKKKQVAIEMFRKGLAGYGIQVTDEQVNDAIDMAWAAYEGFEKAEAARRQKKEDQKSQQG